MPVAKRLSSPDGLSGQEARLGRPSARWSTHPTRLRRPARMRAMECPRVHYKPPEVPGCCGASECHPHTREIPDVSLLPLLHACGLHTGGMVSNLVSSPRRPHRLRVAFRIPVTRVGRPDRDGSPASTGGPCTGTTMVRGRGPSHMHGHRPEDPGAKRMSQDRHHVQADGAGAGWTGLSMSTECCALRRYGRRVVPGGGGLSGQLRSPE